MVAQFGQVKRDGQRMNFGEDVATSEPQFLSVDKPVFAGDTIHVQCEVTDAPVPQPARPGVSAPATR